MPSTRGVGSGYVMKRWLPVILVFSALAGLACSNETNSAEPLATDGQTVGSTPIASSAPTPIADTKARAAEAVLPAATEASSRAYRDPLSGELTTPPRNSVNPLPSPGLALSRSVDTSSDGLVEIQTRDGVKVDLQGRFSSARFATLTPDGRVVVSDGVPSEPSSVSDGAQTARRDER